MFPKTLSAYLGWIACLIIATFFSCTTDAPNDSADNVAASQFIQEKLKQVKILQDSFEYDRAIEILQTLRQGPDFLMAFDSSKSNVHHKYGLMLFNKEDYHRATLHLDTAILFRSNIKKYRLEQLANSYFIRAQAKLQLQEETALADIQQAIEYINQAGSDQNILAEYYIFMAVALQNRGDFGQAEYYYQKNINGKNIKEGSVKMAMLYTSLSTFYGLQNKIPEQRDAIQKALRIYNQLGDQYERNYFTTAIIFGTIYLYEGNWREAETYFKKLYEEIRQSKNSYLKLEEDCLNNLAYASIRMNKPQKAYAYYTDILNLSEKVSSSPYIRIRAIAYEGFGDVEVLKSNFTAAISNYHKAVQSLFLDFSSDDIYSVPSVDQHPVISRIDALRILGLKADAHLKRFDASQQQIDLDAALQIYHFLDALLTNIRQEYKAASSRFNIVKESIPIYEKASLIALQLYELNQDKKYLYQAFNFAAKNKAIVLQDGLQNERAKFAGIPAKLLNQENALKKEHYQLEAEIIEMESTGKETKELVDKKNKRFEVIQAYEKLIQKLEQDYPKYYKLKYEVSQVVDPETIAANLPEETAVIEFFVGPNNLFIFTISSKGLKHYVLPKPGRLFTRTRKFRKMLQESDYPLADGEYSKLSYSLYQSLLETPLKDLEQQGEVKRLIIIPDNQLLQISFDALLYEEFETNEKTLTWDNAEIPYLLKKYAISYAYSNKLITDPVSSKRIQKSLNTFAGFGLEYDDYTLEGINELSKLEVDTTLSRGMGKLYHSVSEIEEVRDILGEGDLWRDQKATKESFLEYAPKSKILHLAMHGYESAENPLNSALIFTRKGEDFDFLLKAADLYTMSLHSDMAVLSACHTASGRVYEGEGVRSLARAFRYAGCPSLVSTLWSVSDYSTKEIIITFYKHLKEGDSKDLALQKAKLNYLRTGQPSQKMPYFWTNLVLIGETRALDF